MPLLRFQNLFALHEAENEHREKHKALIAPLSSSNSHQTPVSITTSQPSRDGPKITWEKDTPFGKLSISDMTVSQVGMSLKALVANATCGVDACKESLGVPTFRKEEAERLVRTGVLDGDQWMIAPEGQLVQFKTSPYAVYGSLTFTAPMETYDLICKSSAFNALMALITIGGMLGPVERTVQLVVAGALDGIFEDGSDLGRSYIENGLRRALLRTYAAERISRQSSYFDQFLLKRLQEVPVPVCDLCAKSEEDVRTFGIDDSQLGSIAEWAFASTNPRNLVLWNKVEALAAAVVSSFFKSRRLAVVDCGADKCQLFDGDKSLGKAPGLAIYQGGDAQKAIEILHQINWLQPVMRAESKRVPKSSPYLRLSCSIGTSLKLCAGFLQSVGIKEDDANQLVNAIKNDAIEQFARKITVSGEEQASWSISSQDNNVDVNRVISHQPKGQSVELGTITYHGYTAAAIQARPAIKELHHSFMKNLPANVRWQDSDVSGALGEVAGLIFALALSCVHILDQTQMRDMKVSADLGGNLRSVYSLLRTKQAGVPISISRQGCLGILAQLWLDLPGIYLSHWPQSSLGISNSQGAVVSAVFADTKSLEDATTKFVVSTAVPDLMVGEKPVVACASTPRSVVQKRGHQVDVASLNKEPYDGCWQICCITTTGGQPPPLEKGNILSNVVSVVPVCGYIACGARWWEYVDLDDAFAVMADSQNLASCLNCPKDAEACWLEQEIFLGRAQRGGFSCSLPRSGQKLVVPAHQNGLMQGFLCGVFRGSTKELRYRYRQCVTHTQADVLIV
ncbi:hypothetical protein BGZ60DRAFT_556814 [Tricladium varicosporioides]|nr:hypothetical protein BGZ60DRAFT_556814 [Hymenoscyphus varicosporioides]